MSNDLCLDIRGLNSKKKQVDFRIMLGQQDLEVLALIDTKIKKSRITKAKNRIWRQSDHLFAVDESDKIRIWLLWSNRDSDM